MMVRQERTLPITTDCDPALRLASKSVSAAGALTLAATKGIVTESNLMSNEETFEQRSCLRKTRFSTEPETDANSYAYECDFCKGWHIATSKHKRNGDVRYTENGRPIVPYCGPPRRR